MHKISDFGVCTDCTLWQTKKKGAGEDWALVTQVSSCVPGDEEDTEQMSKHVTKQSGSRHSLLVANRFTRASGCVVAAQSCGQPDTRGPTRTLSPTPRPRHPALPYALLCLNRRYVPYGLRFLDRLVKSKKLAAVQPGDCQLVTQPQHSQ